MSHFPVRGVSLHLDGNAWVSAPRQATYDPTTGITVCLWVNLEGNSNHGSYLLDTRDPNHSSAGGYALSIDSTGHLNFEVAGLSPSAVSGAAVATTGWQLVGGEYDPAAGCLSVFIGSSVSSASVTDAPTWDNTDTAATLVLGTSASHSAGLIGNLADACIYRQILSPSAISAATSSADFDCPAPIAHWPLAGDTGGSVSGAGYNNLVEVSANDYNSDGSLAAAVSVVTNLQSTATAVNSNSHDVAVSGSTQQGYLMYSAQDVHTRFVDVDSNDSNSFIAVFWDSIGGCWDYDNGTAIVEFTPAPTDLLVATFNAGGASTLYGQAGFVHGIQFGYGGASDGLSLSGTGPYTVSGTSFVENRVTQYGYDWRGRQISSMTFDGTNYKYTYTSFNNAGEPLTTQTYEATTPWTVAPASDTLLAESATAYDSLGQVWETSTYLVDNSQSPPVGPPQTTSYWYDLDGNRVALADPAGNVTTWVYNGLGQETQSCQGQMLGSGSDWTFNNLALADDEARSLEVFVHLGSAPGQGWQGDYSVSGSASFTAYSSANPSGAGWYDLGAVAFGTNDNSTSVMLSKSGSLSAPEEVSLGYSERFNYVGAQLHDKVDRDGRATKYDYDGLGRVTGESWYPTANTNATPTETITYVFDPAGRLYSATDQIGSVAATDVYTYDAAGQVQTDTKAIPGLDLPIVLSSSYAAGNRSQLAVALDETNDFVNNYLYASDPSTNPFGQMSQVTQTSNGGNTVADKTATFEYDRAGEFTGVSRYQYADATTNLVAQAAYAYDSAGQLTSIGYADQYSAALDEFEWTFDALGNIATSSSSLDAGPVAYSNDSTGQLLSDGQTGQSYEYDPNGNRLTVTTHNNPVGCQTGPNNGLLFDGTYTYAYDAEGNLTARWMATTTSPLEAQPGTDDTQITIYSWDNRNRLMGVAHYPDYANCLAGSASADMLVTYVYDANNRWIGETITTGSGETATTRKTAFVYDGNQIVMQFDSADGNDPQAADLSHRYLWGPAVDQLMADEQVVNGLSNPGNVVWTLGDNQNTVRDLATYSSGVATVVNHRVFSAYGQLLSQTKPGGGAIGADCLFAFTGRPMSRFSIDGNGGVTGIQNNLNRWYDAITGRWLSQDPIAFTAGDANLYRYASGSPTSGIDPTGQDRWLMTNGFHWWLVVDLWNSTGTRVVGYQKLEYWVAGYRVVEGGIENWATEMTCKAMGVPVTPAPPTPKPGSDKPGDGWVYAHYLSNAKQDNALISLWQKKDRESQRWWIGFSTSSTYLVKNCLTVSSWYADYGGPSGPPAIFEVVPPSPPPAPAPPGPPPPEPPPPRCFLPGTLVHTSGGLSAIEDIRPGVRVWSFDHRTQEWGLSRATHVHEHEHAGIVLEILADGFSAKVTGEHCFWVAAGDNLDQRAQSSQLFAADYALNNEGRWVAAKSLMAGDVLLGRNRRKVVVRAINQIEAECKVYNLTVERTANYAVQEDGILVHNTKVIMY